MDEIKNLLDRIELYSEKKHLPNLSLVIEKDGSGILCNNVFKNDIGEILKFDSIKDLLNELKIDD